MRRLVSASMMWAAVGLAGVASAYDSGNELWEDLTRPDNKSRAYYESTARAAGYIVGVSDALVFSGEVAYPPSVTRAQTVEVVRRHLQVQPDSRQRQAFDAVRAALVDAFPGKQR